MALDFMLPKLLKYILYKETKSFQLQYFKTSTNNITFVYSIMKFRLFILKFFVPGAHS
jgi:hypothetical protein